MRVGHWLCALVALVSAAPPAVHHKHFEYTHDQHGHFEFGAAVGRGFREQISTVLLRPDPELQQLLDYVNTSSGRDVLAALTRDSQAAFPLYYQEVLGMAEGAGVPVEVMLVNNFREELVQFAIPTASGRLAKCSSTVINRPETGTMALGHVDDWTQDWRDQAYFVTATEHVANASGQTMAWGSWVYPGYLAGMDISWNSHGLVYAVNSLFPKRYMKGGVGTAFVARGLLHAVSIQDAIDRASYLNVSSAMSYQLGWHTRNSRRLLQLEVDTGGGEQHSAVHEVRAGESYFHGNEFVVLQDAQQFLDNSTRMRAQRWREMQPVEDIGHMRGFLGDTKGPYPVYRNHTAPDDCYTEVTGIFDLNRHVLDVWTGNSKLGAPNHTFQLGFD